MRSSIVDDGCVMMTNQAITLSIQRSTVERRSVRPMRKEMEAAIVALSSFD